MEVSLDRLIYFILFVYHQTLLLFCECLVARHKNCLKMEEFVAILDTPHELLPSLFNFYCLHVVLCFSSCLNNNILFISWRDCNHTLTLVCTIIFVANK
jgi:hypothetical protein